MFGLKFYQTNYVEALEREIDYWRTLFQSERLRGDRLADQLLVQVGQLPATETYRDTVKTDTSAIDARFKQREKELAEIYSDSIEDAEGEGLFLPEELAVEVATLKS